MLDHATNEAVANTGGHDSHCLGVKVGTHVKLIELAQIICVRAAGNYVDLVMADGKIVHTKETLSHVAGRLPEAAFIRVHRSSIVNREYVREIQSRQNNYELTLVSGARLLTSASYRKHVRSQFLVGLKGGSRLAGNALKSNVVDMPFAAETGQSGKAAAVKTRIRAGVQGDEYALAFLGKITFVETYSGVFANEDILLHHATHNDPATYRTWLEDKGVCVWLVETESGNIPVGYMVLTPPVLPFSGADRDCDLEIQRIYLLKPFRGMGLGTRLMAQAVQHARRAGYARLLLGDYQENSAAIAFYYHAGFHRIGEYLNRIGEHGYNDIVFSLDL